MSPVTPNYTISSSIVARKVTGELLLVPVAENLGDLSVMYASNETGTRIWDLLVQKHPLPEIKKILTEEYLIDGQNIEKDLQNFLEQLVSIGALIQEK